MDRHGGKNRLAMMLRTLNRTAAMTTVFVPGA